MTTFHCHIDTKDAIENMDRNILTSLLVGEKDEKLSLTEILTALVEDTKKGYRKENGSCAGHPTVNRNIEKWGKK